MASSDEADMGMESEDISAENMDDIKKSLLSDLSDDSPLKSVCADNMPPPPIPNLHYSSENMNIYLRVRPLKDDEKSADEEQGCVSVRDSTVDMFPPKASKAYAHAGGKSTVQSFSFNQIYDELTSQKIIFEDGMLPTVKEFIDGQNCLVFAYGVTNSGKTYTMLGPPKDQGIIPRSLEVIFNSIGDKQQEQADLMPKLYCEVKRLTLSELAAADKFKTMVINTASKAITDTSDLHSSCDSIASMTSVGESLMESTDDDLMSISTVDQGNIKFSVWVSFAEIYNEQIYDLLEPPSKSKRKTLSLREDKNGNPYIKDLRHIHVCSAYESVRVMAFGQRNLQYACTKLNESSSRSHCIFNVKIVRVADVLNPRKAQMSQLSFCDLAGSERYARTGNTGDRLKEAANINTSLLTLGRCIQLLRQNQLGRATRMVPFRESKLTRLFQTYFCGKGRASMFVNISPAASSFDENLQALKFSAIAKQIQIIPEKLLPAQTMKARTELSIALERGDATDSRTTIPWGTTEELEEVEEVDEERDVEQYQEAIEKLKKALIDTNELLKQERKASRKLESDLRKEICKEMMEQITEIENNYQQQMEAHKQRYEDAAEKKVLMITSAVKKSVKRKREESEEERNTLLQALQVKLQRKEQVLQDAQETISRYEKQGAQPNTQNEEADIANNEIFIGITKQLEEATSMLKEKDTMNAELEQTLDEAREMFNQQEEAKKALQSEVNELKALMDEKTETLDRLQCEYARTGAELEALRSAGKAIQGGHIQVSSTASTPFKAMHTKSSLLRLKAAIIDSPNKVNRCLDRSCHVNILSAPGTSSGSSKHQPSRLESDTRATKKRKAATKRRVSNVLKRVYETRSRVKRKK